MENSLPGLLWRPSPNRVTIDYPLSVDDALARLQAGFNDEFRGRVENNGVKLWRARTFAASRNTFAPIFYGVVVPGAAGGSQIRGHFQMHPVTRLYAGAWVGLSSLLALVFLAAAALRATPESTAADALPILFIALLPLAGWLLVRFQQGKGRADEEAMRVWMGTVLEKLP